MKKNEIYTFDVIRNRDGIPSIYHKLYHDEKPFTVNPTLIKQLQLDRCFQKSPEGKAIWLYMRLCQVLKYDENYFYEERQHIKNSDAKESFDLVEKVTADTPTTCFNITRIMANLMNKIPGVHAVLISVGTNVGHFRLGFYTDKISVDAEAVSPVVNHFSDLARLKLGLKPRGFKVYNGSILVHKLVNQMVPQFTLLRRQALHEYLTYLDQDATMVVGEPQIDIEELIKTLKKYHVDGNTAVQLIKNINHQFMQPPYKLLRVGFKNEKKQVCPQLLVRQNKYIQQIDLTSMVANKLPVRIYREKMNCNEITIPEGVRTEDFLNFSRDLVNGEDEQPEVMENSNINNRQEEELLK